MKQYIFLQHYYSTCPVIHVKRQVECSNHKPRSSQQCRSESGVTRQALEQSRFSSSVLLTLFVNSRCPRVSTVPFYSGIELQIVLVERSLIKRDLAPLVYGPISIFYNCLLNTLRLTLTEAEFFKVFTLEK